MPALDNPCTPTSKVMFIDSFMDEVIKTGRPGLSKMAGKNRLVERLMAAGALSGAAGHVASKTKSSLAGEYAPPGTTVGAATKGTVGGLLAALGIKALGKMGRRRL